MPRASTAPAVTPARHRRLSSPKPISAAALAPIPLPPLVKLPRRFYARNTQRVAHELLGKLLVHHVGDEIRVGRIVEVEAYLGPTDLAAHTSKGLTARTKAMFGPPGHAYVNLLYGMHH
jgi:DNA-3-methyladenine glycosylase